MKKLIKGTPLAVVLTTLLVVQSHGQLVTENFSYSDGNLTDNSTWTSHSGAGNSPVQVVSGGIEFNDGSGSLEDVSLTSNFTAAGAGDTYFAGFDLTVTDPGSGGIGSDYFAHFMTSTTNFSSRIFIDDPTTSGFRLGIASDDTTPNYFGTDLVLGQTYRIVTSYDFDTGTSSLWIDPSSGDLASPDATEADAGNASEGIQNFGFRQDSDIDSVQRVDNLVVSTDFATAIPEPSSIALLGLGAAGLYFLRRRK